MAPVVLEVLEELGVQEVWVVPLTGVLPVFVVLQVLPLSVQRVEAGAAMEALYPGQLLRKKRTAL